MSGEIGRREKRRLRLEREAAVRRRAARRPDIERRQAAKAAAGRRLYVVSIEMVARENLFQHPAAIELWRVARQLYEIECIGCGAELLQGAVRDFVFARRRKSWTADTWPLCLCPDCAGKNVRACAQAFFQGFFDREEPGKHLAFVKLVTT